MTDTTSPLAGRQGDALAPQRAAGANVAIRRYEPPDAAPTLRLFERAIRITARARYTEQQVSAWLGGGRDLDEWDRDRRATETFVAVLDDQVVGFADLAENGYVDRLFVDPDFGRRGVGARLLDHVRHRARARGITRLSTHASLVARPVFEAAGFVVVERETVRRGDVELDRFVMAMDVAPDVQFTGRPARERAIELSDGRTLAWGEFGAPDGIPVVFFAGAASSRAMNAYGAAAAARSIRMLTFDRPGLGDSTFDPRKSLTSVAADVEESLDRLGVGAAYAMANSQGGAFALAAAARGRFRRTALVSPADEIAHPEVRKLLAPALAEFVDRIERDPEAVVEQLSGFDAGTMFDFVLSSAAPSDAPVFGSDGFRALFRSALEGGFRQGGRGYAQDTVLVSRPWGVPAIARDGVQIWFGEDDDSHSPDQGATLAARLGADLRVVPEVGGALLWTRTAEIFDALISD